MGGTLCSDREKKDAWLEIRNRITDCGTTLPYLRRKIAVRMREMARSPHRSPTHPCRMHPVHASSASSAIIVPESGINPAFAACPLPSAPTCFFFFLLACRSQNRGRPRGMVQRGYCTWYIDIPLTAQKRHYTLRHIPHTHTVHAGSRLVLVLLQWRVSVPVDWATCQATRASDYRRRRCTGTF